MTFRRSLAGAMVMVMSLGMAFVSHAADPVPFDFSKTMTVSEPIVNDEGLRMTTTDSLVKYATNREARLRVNRKIESKDAPAPPVFTAVVPFVPSPNAVEIPAFPWAERPRDAEQAREMGIGSELRYLADTLRHTADRRDHEINTLSRDWGMGRDEELIQRQWTFVQKLRAVAEAADASARAIESDIDP
ncbi:MAG: hypothetical protein L0H94_06690 [Nitrospira sp.]|nr:hypothetical protein [Nitrospira sp.]